MGHVRRVPEIDRAWLASVTAAFAELSRLPVASPDCLSDLCLRNSSSCVVGKGRQL